MEDGSRRWLLCSSRGERYGLELRWVRQIDYRPQVLPLPTAPPPLVGLISWQGRQVPVLSLDQLLGNPTATRGQAALMLDVGGRPVGLLVDEVGETMNVPGDGLFGLDQALAGQTGLVTEAIRIGRDLVFRINAEKLPVDGAGADANGMTPQATG